ncbi:MAG: response regulator transcription factor [Anaerolineales bacterium]|nr:MAG: response regulator transcription factor [Anaerolineales bacterium]
MPKILVVDDQPELLEMIRAGLSLSGYQVCAASSGQAALYAASHFWPDLVIMDVNMPGLSGPALCAKLNQAAGAQMPILLISAMATAEELQATLQAGAHEYLRKPFELGQLLQRVDALLSEV